MLNPCDSAFAATLSTLLPEGTLSAPEPRHLEEPRGRWIGQAGVLARPRSTAEVAVIVRTCAAVGVGVVPVSGAAAPRS